MSSTSRKHKKKQLEQLNAQRRTLGLPEVTTTKPAQTIIHDDLPCTIQPKDAGPPFGIDSISEFPPMKDIPERFKDDRNPFVKLQREWFCSGIEASRLVEKAGINRQAALRHLSMLQHSFATSHEHKTAAVAYLMAMWFDAR